MSEMNRKKDFIRRLASFLHGRDVVMSGTELADCLNQNGFTTSYHGRYRGGRGTYRLIGRSYEWVRHSLGLRQEATWIANAFVKKDGTPAWPGADD